MKNIINQLNKLSEEYEELYIKSLELIGKKAKILVDYFGYDNNNVRKNLKGVILPIEHISLSVDSNDFNVWFRKNYYNCTGINIKNIEIKE